MQHTTSARPPRQGLLAVAIHFIAAYAMFVRAIGHFYHHWAKNARHALLALGLLSSLQAGAEGVGASPGGAGDVSWKEEVLLHDGQSIVVQRSQSYRGRFEPGSSAPVGEHTVRFTLPRGQREWRWTSEYAPELGRTNFTLLAIHAKDGVPYIVASPHLCLSYNKWGRPNPPYVIFQGEDNGQWARIPMEQLPREFSTINVVVSAISHSRIRQFQEYGVVPAAKVQEFNSAQSSPENKSIVREPVPPSKIGCLVEHSNGKGRWLGADWFTDQKDLQSCKDFCTYKGFDKDTCPCNLYFKPD